MAYNRSRLFFGNVPPATVAYYFLGSDVSTGNWTPSSGVTLYGVLDEITPSDADYARSGLNPSSDLMEVKFAGVVPPVDTSNFVVSYRIKCDANQYSSVFLFQPGPGLIQQWFHWPGPTSWTQFDQTVDPANVALITDFSDLRLKVMAV
jgi:hypothetical protein